MVDPSFLRALSCIYPLMIRKVTTRERGRAIERMMEREIDEERGEESERVVDREREKEREEESDRVMERIGRFSCRGCGYSFKENISYTYIPLTDTDFDSIYFSFINISCLFFLFSLLSYKYSTFSSYIFLS